MTKSEALRQLRKILVNLYSTEASARLIAEDAGLTIASIILGDAMESCWHEILKEADRQNKVKEIVQLASEAYVAQESELYRVWHEYNNATKMASTEPTSVSDSTESADATPVQITKFSRLPQVKAILSLVIVFSILILLLNLWPNPVLKITNLNARIEAILQLLGIRLASTPADILTTTPTSAPPKSTSQYGYNFESGTQNWTTSEGGFKPITVTTTNQVVYSGVQALQLNPNLRGGDTDIYQHTETVAYFNNTIPEGFGASGPYDLTGKSVSCFVYLPSELAPSSNPQAYIQLFVKDKDFRNQFNAALDIVPANVNKWLQLNLTVGQGDGMDNGFNSQQSNALGISIKLHNQATLNYAGPLYIDHCAIQQT